MFKLLAAALAFAPFLRSMADPAFAITPGTLNGNGTNQLAVACSLTNTIGCSNLFLNGIIVAWDNISSNHLSANTNAFYANVPGILLPSETYNDIFLNVSLDAATPAGTYPATVTLLGGGDIQSTDALASQTFSVVVGAPPLNISQSGTNLTLTWPVPPGGYHLQSTTDLATTAWQDLTNTTPTGAWTQQLVLPLPEAPVFFRLKSP